MDSYAHAITYSQYNTSSITHAVDTAILKIPVPLCVGRPSTIFPDGLVRSSKSPCSVASDKNAAVVSNDALSSGELCVEMPRRLNGL
jgi:hypothetical protein